LIKKEESKVKNGFLKKYRSVLKGYSFRFISLEERIFKYSKDNIFQNQGSEIKSSSFTPKATRSKSLKGKSLKVEYKQISLEGASVHIDPKSITKFQIVGKERILRLQAHDQEERRMWMESIQEHIDGKVEVEEELGKQVLEEDEESEEAVEDFNEHTPTDGAVKIIETLLREKQSFLEQ